MVLCLGLGVCLGLDLALGLFVFGLVICSDEDQHTHPSSLGWR